MHKKYWNNVSSEAQDLIKEMVLNLTMSGKYLLPSPPLNLAWINTVICIYLLSYDFCYDVVLCLVTTSSS